MTQREKRLRLSSIPPLLIFIIFTSFQLALEDQYGAFLSQRGFFNVTFPKSSFQLGYLLV
jgi:hypothetical protein